MDARQDEVYDKAHGIKLGSAADRALDKKRGISDDPPMGRKRGAAKRSKRARSIRGMNA